MTPLSPHAFDARVAQLTSKGFAEYDLDGWTAFFETDVDPYGGIDERHEVCACTRCTLAGAWRDDIGLYAGNRKEIAAMIGEASVKRWEAIAEEMENG
jgi:hypothetical protein